LNCAVPTVRVARPTAVPEPPLEALCVPHPGHMTKATAAAQRNPRGETLCMM
jgi:hypothetical protein